MKQQGTHLDFFLTFEALKDKVHEALLVFENATHEVLSPFEMYQIQSSLAALLHEN